MGGIKHKGFKQMSERDSLLSVTRFASLQGVSSRQVYRYLEGGLPAEKVNNKWKIPAIEGKAWLEQHGISNTIDITEERAKLLRAQADLAELKLAQERREVLNIDDVANAIGEVLTIVKSSMLNLPPKVPEIVFDGNSNHDIEQAVKVLVEEVLNDCSERILKIV
jgi:phage terminase Nu1 subunit (DNA packaging protein)